jgi:hypothetical protein
MARWAPWASLWVAVLTWGCDGCHGPPAKLRVGGEHPHVRCLFMDPPGEGTVRAADVELAFDGRTATVDVGVGPLRVAAFPGPAPWERSLVGFGEAVAAGSPHLVLVVGNLGDTVEHARRTVLEVASSVEVPVLVMAGGRDDAEVVTRALSGMPSEVADRVIDARGLWRLVHGPSETLLVSGAPGGRYARTDHACGYGREDLDAVAEDVGEAEGPPRALVSWAAPAGFGASGLGGQDGGDPWLGAFAGRLSVAHAVFAWPSPGQGAHFSDGVEGAGRWLPPPPPAGEPVKSETILINWPGLGGGETPGQK